jgi:hypothetical protein
MTIEPAELDKLATLWQHHRTGCTFEGDARMEQDSSSGIGTNLFLYCGCGEKFDLTNYSSW